MKTRILGKSGLEVSEVGLGCWQLGNDFGPIDDECASAVLLAADGQHINFWDTADVYGEGLSESRIAEHCRVYPKDRIIATKVGRNSELFPDGYTKEAVRRSLEGSINRLGIETLDLAQLHCVPTEVLKQGDILAWMEDFQKDGLVQHIGVSVETMEEACYAAVHPAVTSIQTIFNMFRQEHIEELFPLAQENDVGIIVRLPLASGVLSGKMDINHSFAESDHRNYNKNGEHFSVGETFSGVQFESAVDFVNAIRANIPAELSMAQAAIRWILDQPAVSTVIAGASRAEQVTENASVSELAPMNRQFHKWLAQFYGESINHHVRGAR